MRFNGERLGYEGRALLAGSVTGDQFFGWTSLPNGANPAFQGSRTAPFEGDEVGTIESVKAVAELYTPVAGEVVEVNERVTDDPEVLNEDPHGDGWLLKVRFSSAGDLKSLMNAEQYEAYVSEG